MKKFKESAKFTAVGILATVFAFVATGLAIYGGFLMFLNYFHVYGAGLFTMFAGIILFVVFILGIVALCLKRADVSLAAAIMSIIATIIIGCCMGVPYSHKLSYTVPILAIGYALAAFIMFALYTLYTPSKNTFVKIQQYELKECEMRDKAERLKTQLELGQVSDEEYEKQSAELLECAEVYSSKAEESKNIVPTKKQKICLYVVPITVMCLMFASIIPSVYYSMCNKAYNGLIREMADAEYGRFCSHYVDMSNYDEILPENYKDMRVIRDEMRDYHVIECFDTLQSYGVVNGSRARVAYKQLMALQAHDSRWGFKTVTQLSKTLLSDVKWQCDEWYFQLKYDEVKQEFIVDTNLPTDVPDSEEGLNCYIYYNSYEEVMTVEYRRYAAGSKDYKPYKISNMRYDIESNEFSIEIYCSETETSYTLTASEQYVWDDFEWRD